MEKLFRYEMFRAPQYSSPSPSYSSSYSTVKTVEPHTWSEMFLEPLQQVATEIIKFFPGLIIAIATLAIGWLIARISQIVFSLFLKSVGFDAFANKIGITSLLEGDDKKVRPHQWFGQFLFWFIMLFAIIASFSHLNFYFASNRLSSLFYFVVTILTTLLAFIVGIFLSFISARVVHTVSERMSVPNSGLYANITRWAILFFTFLICLNQIGLSLEIIFVVLGMAYLTLCITFAIAFGSGGVAWAAKVLDKTLQKK